MGTTVPTKILGTNVPIRFVGTFVPTIFFVPISLVGTVVPTNMSEQYTVYSVIRFFEIIYIFITFNQSNIYDHTIHGTYLDSVPISFFFAIVTPP